QIGKGGGYHYAIAEARNQALPATVFLGGPPALILAAVAPLPENVPELLLASLIAGERLPQVHGHGPHPLVASAEFALVGEVPPHARQPEGPHGDARARAGEDESGNRSLRLFEPVDGHAGLHRSCRQRRFERRLAGARRSGARATAPVLTDAAGRGHRCPRLLRGVSCGGRSAV